MHRSKLAGKALQSNLVVSISFNKMVHLEACACGDRLQWSKCGVEGFAGEDETIGLDKTSQAHEVYFCFVNGAAVD